MSARPLMPGSLALVIAVAAGCADAPPTALDSAPAVARSVTAAAADGATILRFQGIEFIVVFDADRELLAVHMPSSICSGGSFNVLDVLQVITPSEIGQRLAQVKADDAIVAVYHAASPADAGFAGPINFLGFGNLVNVGTFCAFVSGPNRIAEGEVRRISTFTLASFHARWTGTLQGVDGRSYHLTEIYQLNADIHDPSNPATFVEHAAEILLRPRG